MIDANGVLSIPSDAHGRVGEPSPRSDVRSASVTGRTERCEEDEERKDKKQEQQKKKKNKKRGANIKDRTPSPRGDDVPPDDADPSKAVGRLGRFWWTEPLPPRQLERLKEIHAFFTDDIVDSLLYPLITQRYDVSLRALDWLVVNYVKKHHIVYPHRMRGSDDVILINLFSLYKDWLHHWRRRNFDPFRRRQRICFDRRGEVERTTVGQLNFLFWASNYGVIDYARNNIEAIDREMTQCLATSREERVTHKQTGAKRKRCELSKGPNSKCFVYRIGVTVRFDDGEGLEEAVQDADPPCIDEGDTCLAAGGHESARFCPDAMTTDADANAATDSGAPFSDTDAMSDEDRTDGYIPVGDRTAAFQQPWVGEGTLGTETDCV